MLSYLLQEEPLHGLLVREVRQCGPAVLRSLLGCCAALFAEFLAEVGIRAATAIEIQAVADECGRAQAGRDAESASWGGHDQVFLWPRSFSAVQRAAQLYIEQQLTKLFRVALLLYDDREESEFWIPFHPAVKFIAVCDNPEKRCCGLEGEHGEQQLQRRRSV